MSNNAVYQSPAWRALGDFQAALKPVHMKDLFAKDPQRFEKFHIQIPGLLFDYSKHLITGDTLNALLDLTKTAELEAWRDKMFAGAPINTTEQRAVLHTALRGSCDPDLEVDGENVKTFVDQVLAQIQDISEDVRGNSQITNVVNLGIGGSDLGPRMAYKALKPYADGPNIYFVSNIDGSGLNQRLESLKPENTLFIIASKSFTTLETYANAQAARAWLLESIDDGDLHKHIVSVTNNVEAAKKFGIEDDRILPMRDWVGGRYSLWGAIGLPLAISHGFENFKKLLEGAHAADEHFLNAPLDQNIPVIMGMLGVWYRNFWDYPAHAVLPYSHDLRDFPVFMQQMDMESNGKGVDRHGTPTPYKTGHIIFGESGTNSQHTFMQLLHQSPEVIPADFLTFASPNQHPYADHHSKLLGHALAQSKALMDGRENTKEPHRNFTGNRPSSTFIFDRLDPYHLGMLIALYEHKVFTQGILWEINSYDQWGVELGKIIAEKITQTFENNDKNIDVDSSTHGLLHHLTQKFIKS